MKLCPTIQNGLNIAQNYDVDFSKNDTSARHYKTDSSENYMWCKLTKNVSTGLYLDPKMQISYLKLNLAQPYYITDSSEIIFGPKLQNGFLGN